MTHYTIATVTIPRLKETIKKVNKKAVNYGFPEVELIVLEETRRKTVVSTAPYVAEEQIDIEVANLSIICNNWKILANIQKTANGANVLYGFQEIPKHYRTIAFICEHCGYTRQRNKVFILQHLETGEYKQVGSTCLEAFVGNTNLDGWITQLEHIVEVIQYENIESEPREVTFRSGQHFINLREYLYFVLADVDAYGYMSRTKADELGRVATADSACINYFDKRKSSCYNEYRAKKTQEALDWIAGIEDPDSQYQYNLKTICSNEYISFKEIGIVASLFAAYRRSQEVITSRHVGTIKERMVCRLILKDTYSFFTGFERLIRYTFHDKDGNVLTWVTQAQVDPCLSEVLTLCSFTVKAHEVYHGQKITHILRLRLAKR